MPQASDDLRARMERRFGDPVSDEGPMRYLQQRGYRLTRRWTWTKPGVTELKQMTRDEFECLLFLIHEWDFGGLEKEKSDG